MNAMEINKSGTTARDGLSSGVDRGDAIRVGIPVRGLSSGLCLNTEQTLDLRQRGQDPLFWPRLYLLHGQLQQDGQVLVAIHTELGAQRALAHTAIDFCAQLRDCLGLGFRRIWPKDVRTKLVAGDAGGQLNCDATFCGNAAAVVPAGYRRRLDAEKLSKSLLAPCRLNCSIEG